jgi:hypothetical protein
MKALAVGPPQITASWVEVVTSAGASLRADIGSNGLQTKYHFEYISDAAYRANPKGDPFLGSVKTEEKVLTGPSVIETLNAINSDLTPSTAYHYRAVASHEGGSETVFGPEHVFTTKSFSKEFHLPDGRAWEMVSPPDKGGGAIAFPEELFGGGDLQAAAAGGSITYGSGTAFGEAAGAPPVSQYVSRRGPSGWSTENVSPPLDSAAYGDHPDGAPYRVFSADLSRALLFGGLACRGGLEGCPAPNMPLPGSGAPAGYMAYYLRDNTSGDFSSLLEAADVAHSALLPPELEVDFVTATPDLAHVVLSSCAALTANAVEVSGPPGHCDAEAPNLYEWSVAGLRAINFLPEAALATPGAAVAAPLGAVSEDGSRIYWTDGGQLYLREANQTREVDGNEGGGTFQTATPDGSVALFTKAGKLYRFAAAGTSEDLTPAGGVVGVLGASADGETVYYQDANGLQRWHAGTTTTIAEGADATLPSDYPPATATARVSADGLHLVFISKAQLTPFDIIDVATKLPDAQLYVYGPPVGGGPASLICASCKQTGERPIGPASIPGTLQNGSTGAYRPRALSGDGSRLFFETGNDVFASDTNSATDVYEWEAQGAGGCQSTFGCVAPISDFAGRDGGKFIDASADATDVYFLTGDSLVPQLDPGSIDVYDARVNGGLPEPEEKVCVADNCQPLPGEPEDPTPGTLVPNPGNPRLRVIGPKPKKHHRKRHKSHSRGGREHGKTKHMGRGER